MHFSTIFTTTALAGAVFAADHKVAVGTQSGELIFKPDSVQAAEGDTVTFRFWPKNHSVAQAAFANPCQPMARGFWSGYVPTTNTQAVANETFTYTVTNASAPVWFYCTQGQHCQAGMVGVINPPQTGARTLDAFKNASKQATANVAPSSTAGTGGNLTTNGTSTSGSASSSGSSPASTGAASHLTGSATFAGLTGLAAYLLL
ncbi:hypothetical protein ACN47E_007243 [Coniothyrium glycines]